MAAGKALVAAVALIVVGVILAFTDIMLLQGLGGIMVFTGWMLLILGVILLVAALFRHFAFERRTPRERRLT